MFLERGGEPRIEEADPHRSATEHQGESWELHVVREEEQSREHEDDA